MYELLRKVPLFAGLSHAGLADLCQIFEDMRLSATKELFVEGFMEIERISLKRRA